MWNGKEQEAASVQSLLPKVKGKWGVRKRMWNGKEQEAASAQSLLPREKGKWGCEEADVDVEWKGVRGTNIFSRGE